MFGFSLSELVVVAIVALLVVGPKDLPKMLRKLGQWAGKIRRAAADLRAQSGIDDVLRAEGLSDDLAEIRKLARGELDSVQRAARLDQAAAGAAVAAASSPPTYNDDFYVARDREYPRDGADAYGALPDNAIVYAEGLPRSALGRDPLYVTGDPSGVVPEDPPSPLASGGDEGDDGDVGAEDRADDEASGAEVTAEAAPEAEAAAPKPLSDASGG